MVLEVEDLSVKYGSVLALSNINLCVDENEIVALIGNNGAGKTTALNAISGMVKSESGSIKFKGTDISNCKPHLISKMGITHVPEGRRVFYKFTVRENLMMGAYNIKDKQRIKQKLDDVVSLFPVLYDRINQLGGTLSGGEQQMLVFGRALMASPQLLLLDEPSLGLAPQLVDVIADTIIKISDEGIPILLVEQNASLALELSNRTYIMETGSIALQGLSSEVAEDDSVRKTYLGVI